MYRQRRIALLMTMVDTIELEIVTMKQQIQMMIDQQK